MKVQYFGQYFTPEKSSGGYLVTDLLEGFIREGWEVDVYTSTPTRGVTEETRKQYCRMPLEISENGKLRIHRMPLYREGKGFIPRAIRYMLFSLQCLFKGLTEPADLVFTGSGPPTQGLVGVAIKKATRKKFIYNLQDAFPDSMIAAGIATEKSILVKIGRIMEHHIYTNADAIITISNDMYQSVLNKGVHASNVHMVSNWVDTNTIKQVSRNDNKLFDELRLSRENFYVVYAGNIGYVQGIDSIIEAAKMLKKEEDIHFVIFGNGSEEKKIRQMINDYELTNVSMYPLLNADRVSEVYSMGDVSLVTCKPGTGGAGMPSKTWTIMATGTPVLGFFDKPSEFAQILDVTKTGWCVEAGKTEELCDMTVRLYQSKALCKEYGQNAREYAEKYLSKNKAASRYIEIMKKTIYD